MQDPKSSRQAISCSSQPELYASTCEEQRYRALCVNADAETQSVLEQTLSAYDVVFVADANDAVRSINQERFDLYVTDYWLPDWSGSGFCRDIRKTDPYVPIIICTAANNDNARARAARAGASAFLAKPVDLEAMVAEIAAQMEVAVFRNQAARERAVAAIADELERRRQQLQSMPAPHLAATTLERVCHRVARDAFIRAGGTLAAFERFWPGALQAQVRPVLNTSS